jgi:peptidoglycan/xylan/chitin deacetylase (PgdA/CDA1 family)
LFRRLGAGRVAGAITPAGNLRIALTHYVFAEDQPNFERIVDFLVSRRQPLELETFLSYCRGGTLPADRRWIVFTFDDGLVSSFKAALEVLNPMGIKSIFFVPTAILDLQKEEEMRRFCWDRIYHRRHSFESLRPEQYLTMQSHHLHELRELGHVIFPHTHTHIDLAEIRSRLLVDRELIQPRRTIEALVGGQADGFAFPVGTERVVSSTAYSTIQEIYSFCCTGLMGANSDATERLFLYRDSIHASDSIDHVSNVVAGAYDLYYKMKMTRLKKRAQIHSTRIVA